MEIREFLKNNIIILDGGMGTLLQGAGLKSGERPENWNITHPQEIINIHKAYFDAGSNIVNTNTFGANALNFSDNELEQIISAALANAKTARSLSGGENKFIALDIGPTGRLLKPLGDLDFEDAVKVFAKTVRLGVKHGADLVMIETMNDSYETKAALLAAKENCDLPVFVSNAYSENGRLMTGATPEAMVALLEGMGADAIGMNCSFGPDKLADVAQEYLRLASVPVILKPNAGLPVSVGGKTIYNVDAKSFATQVAAQVVSGVRIVGGCCGTTPEYISALKEKVSGIKPKPIEKKKYTTVSSYTTAVTLGKEPVLIGERINPTGKKRLKTALYEKDMGYILSQAFLQREQGAHILDVNVGLPDINEVEMLNACVTEIQAVTDLPLQIDSSNATAMEKALRYYNGKAMINSVSGKQDSMDAIFPLAKKYGGVIIALTLDENGIPETAQGRVDIAKKILACAKDYGIDKRDIVFDTLAMTVSADQNAALSTLSALKTIKEELGCHTSLGVSNISFGLPNRDSINAVFFVCALENGLSAAIMNPASTAMMQTYHAFKTLHGMDLNCTGYINYVTNIPKAGEVGTTAATEKLPELKSELQSAIAKGLKSTAAQITQALLENNNPLDIVNEEIVPALNVVGAGYEKGSVFLPGLLMSAEAAQAAFEVIKSKLPSGGADKFPVVIATVQGDIHDIGKNIVRLLLENYGFAVYDLGRDVAPEKIVEETLRVKAPVVGLSALMTTTVPAMEETVKQLRAAAPGVKIMVGGAVLNKEYAEKIGADKYARDAMESVRYCEELLK